jgi:hypothetical protein
LAENISPVILGVDRSASEFGMAGRGWPTKFHARTEVLEVHDVVAGETAGQPSNSAVAVQSSTAKFRPLTVTVVPPEPAALTLPMYVTMAWSKENAKSAVPIDNELPTVTAGDRAEPVARN